MLFVVFIPFLLASIALLYISRLISQHFEVHRADEKLATTEVPEAAMAPPSKSVWQRVKPLLKFLSMIIAVLVIAFNDGIFCVCRCI